MSRKLFDFVGWNPPDKKSMVREPLIDDCYREYEKEVQADLKKNDPMHEGGKQDCKMGDLHKNKSGISQQLGQWNLKEKDMKVLEIETGLQSFFLNKVINQMERVSYSKKVTFEPRNLVQKLHAIFQNNVEIITFFIIFFITLNMVSLISNIYSFLIMLMTSIAWMNPEARLQYRKSYLLLIILALVITIMAKAYFYVYYRPTSKDFSSQEKSKDMERWLQALGFEVQTKSDIDSTSSFKIDLTWSFTFEIITLLVLIVSLLVTNFYKTQFVKLKEKFEDGDKDFLNINEYEDEIETNQKGHDHQANNEIVGIGTSTLIKKKTEVIECKEHSKIMEKLIAQTPRNYLDCHFIQKNQTSYNRVAIAFNLIHTLSFNSIINLPTLALILIINAIYVYRKDFRQKFLKLCFLLIYIIQLTNMLKLQYFIFQQGPFVQNYLKINENMQTITIFQRIFGVQLKCENKTQCGQIFYFITLFACFYSSQFFIQTKWAKIREVSQNQKDGIWTKLQFFIKMESKIRQIQRELLKIENIQSKINKMNIKRVSNVTEISIKKYYDDIHFYLPTALIWLTRIQVVIQAYMYHNGLSLFHLFWVVFSFVFTQKVTLGISIMVMIPLYTSEFLIIYLKGVPAMSTNLSLQSYYSIFNMKMEYPLLEQLFYFSIMSNFWMMISAFKGSIMVDQNNYFKLKLHDRVYDNNCSIMWKFLFYALKSVHILVLISLFYTGYQNLDTFQNLGFMVFFVVYVTNDTLYRKTSKLLVVFIAFFILCQYYYSLKYHVFEKNEKLNKSLLWLGFYYDKQIPSWKKGSSIYFRYLPYLYEWVLLILMSLLNMINILFKNNNETQEMQRKCYQQISITFSSKISTISMINGLFKNNLVYLIVGVMMYQENYTQINMISSLFQVLQTLNAVFVVSGSNSTTVIQIQIALTFIMKYLSCLVILLETLFISFVGSFEQNDINNQLALKLKRELPWFYKNLNFVGVRVTNETHTITQLKQQEMVQEKLAYYVFYMIMSIMMNRNFRQKYQNRQSEGTWSDSDYKKLFQYQTETIVSSKKKKLKLIEATDDSISRYENYENNDKTDKNDLLAFTFVKKKTYTKYDLIERYEFRRYQTPFIVFKLMDWWPIFDIIATYGHFINSFIIMFIGIYFSISIYMCFNISSVCLYYLIATVRLSDRAFKNYKNSCLQSQVGLNISKVITKDYNIGAFYEFLKIRRSVWYFQITIFVLVMTLRYPTPILYELRERYNYEMSHNTLTQPQKTSIQQQQKTANEIEYWFFMIGILRPKEESSVSTWIFVILLLGLFFEKCCINWLTDRWGCNYNKLQKFLELEQRHRSIQEKWEICPPPYNPKRYKDHYFKMNFKDLLERFDEQHYQSQQIMENSKENEKEFREFITYKQALSVKKLIQFTVQLDGRCKDLKISPETSRILDLRDKEVELQFKIDDQKQKIHKMFNSSLELLAFNTEKDKYYQLKRMQQELKIHNSNKESLDKIPDYEEIDILKNYKMEMLGNIIQQCVDSKYKISLTKGRIIFLQSVIVFILLLQVALKANIFSILYLLIVFKYTQCESKIHILVRMAQYISISLLVQYIMFMINLTNNTSPQPFPEQFKEYSLGKFNWNKPFPLMFQNQKYQDLKLGYMLAIGIDKSQLEFLMLDFLNLYLVSMYILNFLNPILFPNMEKVFWELPQSESSPQQWARVHKNVKKTIHYFDNLSVNFELEKQKYLKMDKQIFQNMTVKQHKKAEQTFNYAKDFYNRQNYQNLNQLLIDYVDLKYEEIWSDEFCKKIKGQFKVSSYYFRIVKQGSILVYLSFHILTLCMIICLAIIRQSILSLIYMLIILPKIDDVSQVFRQRIIVRAQQRTRLCEKIQNLEFKIADYSEYRQNLDMNQKKDRDELKELNNEIDEMKRALSEMQDTLKTELMNQKRKTKRQREEEKIKDGENEWSIIKQFQINLKYLALFDFTLQIIIQFPMIKINETLKVIGFKKIWDDPNGDAFNYSSIFNNTQEYQGLQLNQKSFFFVALSCGMIAAILLQIQIFNSPGYQKFIKQSDGSMDLLIQLSSLKGKSVAFCFNNKKIQKHISIQKYKENILDTVEDLKIKLFNWRNFKNKTITEQLPKETSFNRRMSIVSPSNRLSRRSTKGQRSRQISIDDNQYNQSISLKNNREDKKQVSFLEVQILDIDFSQDSQSIDTVEEYQIDIGKNKRKKIDRVEARKLQYKMAQEIKKILLKKLGLFAKFYLYINKYFVQQIFFKNNRQEVEKLLQSHSSGQTDIPSELEIIILEEALEFVQCRYDNSIGAVDLQKLNKKREKNRQKNILDLADMKEPIHLKNMKRSYEYIRYDNLIFHYVETLFYLFISHLSSYIYLAMIFSMYANSGLLSLVYPFSVFGYALLEETRPKQFFWAFIRKYTTFVLFIKLIFNLNIENLFLKKNNDEYSFSEIAGWVKIGIYKYDSITETTLYFLPEIMILMFLTMNEIYLRMLGLYFETEDEIENIVDGLKRNIEHGDEDKVNMLKDQRFHMNMKDSFQSKRIQKKNYDIEIRKRKDQERKQSNFYKTQSFANFDPCGELDFVNICGLEEEDLEERQTNDLINICNEIKHGSKHFKVEQKQLSRFDKMVQEKCLSKMLENDQLIYMEGRPYASTNFISVEEKNVDQHEAEKYESLSAADHKDEFAFKVNQIAKKDKNPNLGIFEASPYFINLFPSLLIQKPGYDLYGATTIFMFILCIYIFSFYSEISVNKEELMPSKANNSDIFDGNMIMNLLFVIGIMIIERYANRSDTKVLQNKGILNETSEKRYYGQEKTSKSELATEQKLRSFNTVDLDKEEDSTALLFLEDMYQKNSEQQACLDDEYSIRITPQQKTKYVMHIFLLILVHVYVFWFIPIQGNFKLYGSSVCDPLKMSYYGCKDFHQNPALMIFYFILCIYFLFSSLQIRYGFPIMKKTSSVLQYHNQPIATVCASLYWSLPFIIEIRCLLDFTMSKTSLDIFQYWQLFQYNWDMYICKNGNVYYTTKIIGARVGCFEKFIFGWLFSFLVLCILCGPLLLFSSLSGLVAPNPALNGDIQLQFIFENSLTETELNPYITGQYDKSKRHESVLYPTDTNLVSEVDNNKTAVSYLIYENSNPLFRTLDYQQHSEALFHNWTETRYFQANQIQVCLANEYSDNSWMMSNEKKKKLGLELSQAFNINYKSREFYLGIYTSFTRLLPPTHKKTSMMQKKYLNTTLLDDCLASKELQKIDTFDCDNPSNKNKSLTVTFTQAYDPYLILGQTSVIYGLGRKSQENNQVLHDIKATFICPNQWIVHSSINSTIYSNRERQEMIVDPETCELKNKNQTLFKALDKQVVWDRVSFTLFSMLVSSSFLASYNLTSFYVGVVVLLGQSIRIALIWPSYKGYIYEITTPDAIISLIEAVYMKRHEEDLIGEEECYRMVQQIIRSPELLSSVCSSSLRGSLDPELDNLTIEQRKQIDHLNSLYRKGFDVKKNIQKIMKSAKEDYDDEYQRQ